MSARSFRRDRLRAIRRDERRSMSRAKKVAGIAGGLFAATTVMASAANAETYAVNSLNDNGDGNCKAVVDGGDGVCTLRDAIQDANSNGTADTIGFAANVRGTIQLAQAGGVGFDALEVTNESLDIAGPGADQLTVAAAPGSRIFKLFGFDTGNEEVTISGLTLSDGNPTRGRFGECAFDPGDGGAILSTNFLECFSDGDHAAALTLSKLNITANDAAFGGGGGVAIEQQQESATAKAATATGEASLTVHQSTISANDAGRDGGGIVLYPGAGQMAFDNSTIVDNNANDGQGGGIFILDDFGVPSKADPTALEIDNSTITGNDATNGGGGIATDTNMVLSSNIVYGNTVTPLNPKASTPSDVATDAATITAGYTMFGTTSGATVTESVAGTNKTGVDPQLGPLQNNGGTTPTRLPATESPAIDAGISNSLNQEQRGTARTIDRPPANTADGTDIGAVEVAADPPVEPTPEPEPTPLPGPAPDFCFGKQVILTKGGDADEKLTGFGVDDGIFAGGGVDEVRGLGGDDCLFGQVGNDYVEGGPGNDNANGDRDDDKVRGDGGSDSVRGQNGNDRVLGGPGDDPKVTGGAGDDFVSGGAGNDFVKGDGGNDVVLLGGGEDFVHSGGGADVVNAADGDRDKIICGTGKDVANVDPIDDVDSDCNTVNIVAGSRRPA